MKINHTDKDYYSDLGIARSQPDHSHFGRYSMADHGERLYSGNEALGVPMEAVGIVQPRWAKQKQGICVIGGSIFDDCTHLTLAN